MSLSCVDDDADFFGDAGPRRLHGAACVVGRDDLVDALAHREERGGGGGGGGSVVVGQAALVGDHGRGEGDGAAAASRDTKEKEGAEQRRDI